MDRASRGRSVEALRAGIERGMTHIDTAEMYGDAESIVGEAMTGRRDEVFLVSKVVPSNASRKGTIAACERSLRQLGTDRLDCYLLHWPGSHPLRDTVAAFQQLVGDGKIRSWGVSNFDESDLDALVAVEGGDQVACNQVLYHLGERAIEHAVMPWCEAHGVAVVAYSPFGQGRFPSPDSRGGRILSEIARAHHATPPQVALAFLSRGDSTFTIPKSSNIAHVEENAGAGDLILTAGEIAEIDVAFPRGRKRNLPML
jgi:diketogulonate reductase-like aldo/keto reductase